MSSINVTIPGDAVSHPCHLGRPAANASFSLISLKTKDNIQIGAAFFLAFACTTVELSLTDAKSKTYKSPSHSHTGPVHLYTCTDPPK